MLCVIGAEDIEANMITVSMEPRLWKQTVTQ